MRPELIRHLQQLLTDATPGPWTLTGTATSWLVSGIEAHSGMPVPIVARFQDGSKADAVLIVALHNAASVLLEELAEAWAAIERSKA